MGRGALSWGAQGRGSLAHRCADRLTGTVVPANRGTSSKPACFIRHWRRFADFPSRGRGRTPPLRKRYKRCNGRATARVAPTDALQGVRCGGPMWASAPADGFFGEYPYTISPKRAQVLLSVIFMSRYWPRADLSPTRCTRRPPAVRPERGQRASSVSPSTRQRRVLPT